MGIVHSPNIVTDQLKFYVDAANLKSKPDPAENLIPISNQFNITGWAFDVTNVTISLNQTTSPSGFLDAAKVTTKNQSYGNLIRYNGHTYSTSTTYTLSVYAKAGNYNYIGLSPMARSSFSDPLGGDRYVYFNLSTGAAVNSITNEANGHTIKDYGMVYAGNGWYRCYITVITSASTTTGQYITDISIVGSNGSTSWTPAGTEYVYLYGLQLERNSAMNTYLPTTSGIKTYSGLAKNYWQDLISGQNLYYGADMYYKDKSVQFRENRGTYAYLSNFDNGILKNDNRTGQWTLEAYFKHMGPTTISGGENVIIGRAGCHGGIYINADNTLNYAIKSDACWGGALVMYVANLVPGNTYHTVFTYNNGVAKAYLNGAPAPFESTKTFDLTNRTFFGYDNTLWVGGIGTYYDPNADIYAARAYSKELSAAEVLQNYNAVISRYNQPIKSIVDIPTSGLQLFLDAQQAISNNNGGSWLDISGKGNSVSWNTAATFKAGDPSYWTFNGSSTYGTIPNIQFPTAQTLIMILRTNYTSGRKNPWNQSYGGYGTWTHEQGAYMSQYFGNAGPNNNPYIGPSSATTPQNNSWFMLTSTRGPQYQTWYLNGSQSNQTSNPYGILANDSNSILLGNGYAGAWQGDMAVVIAYNRELSATEINQVYTAFKTRYGF
jgi:hypothetical protein